jgi:H+/Cl- antiporter ClcA
MVLPSAAGARFRMLVSRALTSLGFHEDGFLLVIAAAVGIVTAFAAVGFHELIDVIRNLLYRRLDPEFLYRAGSSLLIVWPALGGLVVGIISHQIARVREGKGVIDVLESVAQADSSNRRRPSKRSSPAPSRSAPAAAAARKGRSCRSAPPSHPVLVSCFRSRAGRCR